MVALFWTFCICLCHHGHFTSLGYTDLSCRILREKAVSIFPSIPAQKCSSCRSYRDSRSSGTATRCNFTLINLCVQVTVVKHGAALEAEVQYFHSTRGRYDTGKASSSCLPSRSEQSTYSSSPYNSTNLRAHRRSSISHSKWMI